MTKNPRFILSLAAIFSATALSGCLPLFKSEKEIVGEDDHHPIIVEPDTASVSVPVPENAAGLDPQGARDMRAFFAVYKARGHGPVTIARPTGSANEKQAHRVSDDLLRLATESGVDPTDIMPQTYQVPAGEKAAPVTVTFTRFVASVAPCGEDWSTNWNSSLRNEEPPSFGCATHNNIAAMLEDPHDLVAPRNMSPADAERRGVIFGKYRKGMTTVTDRADTEKADVAKVGGE
jgi:pilus assembly protein CpaD